MAGNALLTELDRQRKTIASLPADYPYPIFHARRALESQRASAYRNTAAASREIVDNAIEAGADRVDVVFNVDMSTGRRSVHDVAFVDNGPGMVDEMARFALSWGGGTHFDDSDFIGKFGFGLPNASINQTRTVEVYTRTDGDQPWSRVTLAIDSFTDYGMQSVPEAQHADLPRFVTRYLAEQGITLTHGTVVVWVDADRLSYRRRQRLLEHLLDDFGITYRYLLHKGTADASGEAIDLYVDGAKVGPVDPLFLLPGARYYVPESEGGAMLTEERDLPVRLFTDPETGERQLELVEDEADLNIADPDDVVGTFLVRIARLPLGFAEPKKTGQRESDADKRFQIRKGHRGMAFVRANREIQTVDAFPRSATDIASGLGRWPLLQSYAYGWGVEVRFKPELDEIFGITNDKQGVRPIADFWRVLAKAGIDEQLRIENRWQADVRRERRTRTPEREAPAGPSPAERAARAADVAIGRPLALPQRKLEEARHQVETHARAQLESGQATSIKEAREAVDRERRRRPYLVTYHSVDNGPFYEPVLNGQRIEVRVNTLHPFYTEFYGDLARTGPARAKESVDLVLIALARTELTADEPVNEIWLSGQRRYVWSPFLETALRSLATSQQNGEEEETGNGDPAEPTA
jgi:hypothetical protein